MMVNLMKNPALLSVIIPAYNKLSELQETLRALEGQVLPEAEYEVIVVDDGSTDGTLDWLREHKFPFPCQVYSQANKGPGAARNLGATQAYGEVLLFLDADIVAAPGLLGVHWAAHQQKENILVAGRVRQWMPQREGPAHQVFARIFDLGEQARELPFPFMLTQNLSIKASDFALLGHFNQELIWGEDTEFGFRAVSLNPASVLEPILKKKSDMMTFDENLPRGQDTDLGYRATHASFKILYYPQAVAFHNHVLNLAQICTKAQEDHERLVILFKKHPQILQSLSYLQDKLPVDWKHDSIGMIARKSLRSFLALPPVLRGMRRVVEALEGYWPDSPMMTFLVWKIIGGYQWVGLRKGMKRYGWQDKLQV